MGATPFFIRTDGMIIHLAVENYIPNLLLDEKRCKPRKPTGSMIFCSVAPSSSRLPSRIRLAMLQLAHGPNPKNNKTSCEKLVAPSDEESADVEEVNGISSGEEGQSVSDDECVDHLPPATNKSFAGR